MGLEPKEDHGMNPHPSDTRYTAACWEDKEKVIIGIVIGQKEGATHKYSGGE